MRMSLISGLLSVFLTCALVQRSHCSSVLTEDPLFQATLNAIGTCAELPDILNGMIVLGAQGVPGRFEHIAMYSCNSGYLLNGVFTRTCVVTAGVVTGDYDGVAPVCEPICDQLSAIANGVISYSPDMVAPYSVGTVATYSCNEGYILRMGDEMRTCRDNGDGSGGDFNGTAPTCEPQCPSLPSIMNGTISYSPDSTPDYDVGTVATYVCDEGFFLIGSPTRECQSDRTFSGAPPVCIMIPVCPELPAIANGMIAYSMDETPRQIGTVATYTCNNGFFHNGVMTRTCVEVGMFDQEAPTCDPIECDPLDPLVNGGITYSPDTVPDYELGTEADHMCNRGFRLVGPQTRVCEDVGGPNGEFNQQSPICEQITCSDLPMLANVVISYSGGVIDARPVDTEASYQCEDGFDLVGDSTRTCQEDGMFDGMEPFCTPFCSDLPELVNGMIDYSTDTLAPYPIGTMATYSCNDGYVINGPENRTCEGMGSGGSSSSVFNLRAPVCDPVCDEIPEPPLIIITYPTDPNPQFPDGTVAVATCREGFSPGTTGMLPTTTIELVCTEVLPGGGGVFVIPGTSTNTLNCEPTCNELPVISNGVISYSTDMEAPYILGTVATYVCIDGYELVGDMTRNCVNSSSGGMFDGSELFCRAGCAELPPIPNGMISYATDATLLFEVGTVATYSCNEGYILRMGDETRTCRDNGDGSGRDFDGTAPTCGLVECPPLPPIANGFITYAPDTVANYSLGTNATYNCNAGFILSGPPKRTCQDDDGMDTIGKFSEKTPSCIAGCSAEEYQSYSWPDTRQGLTATAPCPCEEVLGELAGEVTRQCLQTSLRAEWSAELDFSKCEVNISRVSQELCDIALGNQSAEVSEQLVNITSQTSLTSNEVVLVTTVLEETTSMAATNPEVRDNYLQTIDNIQQSDPDVLMESQRTMNSTTRILTSLETLLDTLDLNSTVQNSTTNRTTLTFNTFAVQVEDIDVDDFTGQTFIVALGSVEQARTASGRIDQDALITVDGVTNTGNDSNTTTSSVQLTPDFFKACMNNMAETNSTSQVVSQRLSYSVFLVNSLFLSPENRTVGSIIVTARTKCQLPNNTLLPVPVQTSFQVNDTDEAINSSCAVYNNRDGFGAWNSDGCREISRAGRSIGCECRQLGHFGILLDLNPSPLPEDLSIAVSTITFVGLGLSLICLGLFIFTYFVSKKLQANPHNGIVLHLCISLGGLYIAFLLGGFPTKIPPLCGVMSALLHYFFLVYFAWTAVEAVWLYLKLVKVFGSESLTSRYALKAGMPAWTLPIVIVAISVGAGHQFYISPYYCRPTEWPFFFGLILPFLAVYVFNWIMFFATMISVCRHAQNSNEVESSKMNRQEIKKTFIIAMCLAVTLGLGWGLGLVATSSDYVALTFAFQVIFSIFVGLQGVLIFVFYGLRNADFRDCWKNLCVRRKSQSFKSSSDSNKTNTTKFSPTRDSVALNSLPRKINLN